MRRIKLLIVLALVMLFSCQNYDNKINNNSINKTNDARKINGECLGYYKSIKNDDKIKISEIENKYVFDVYTYEDQSVSVQGEKNEFPSYEFISNDFVDDNNKNIKIKSTDFFDNYYLIEKSKTGFYLKYYKEIQNEIQIIYEGEFIKIK